MSRYHQTRFIGSGTYAEVYEAYDTLSNTKVALKKTQLRKNEGMPSTAIREISILRMLNHPNILSLLDVIHNSETFILVFEYLDYDLKKYLKIHQTNIIPLITQMLKGVAEIHDKRIVHRDLKPQNILVDNKGNLKIADFGLARSLEVRMPFYNSEVVTLWYRSPELLQGNENYSFYIDMWSVGCIICEMINDKVLFKGEDDQNQLQIIYNAHKMGIDEYIINRVGEIPDYLLIIIVGCLNLDFNQRFSARKCLEYI
ncbi:Cell division control protein 2 [Gurleya vavrai]